MKPTISISIIWLVFAVLFFILGWWHLTASMSAMPSVELTQRAMGTPDSPVRVEIRVAGSPIDKPLADFAKDFNEYVSVQNKASRNANLLAAVGYFVAALTALYSGLSLRRVGGTNPGTS